MDALGWRTDLGLGDALHAEPHAFEFFQAVRLLSRAVGDEGGNSGALPFGFRALSDQAYPSGEIRSVSFESADVGAFSGWASLTADDIKNVVLDVVRTGLVGPRSPLPTAHAEWVQNEQLEAIRLRLGRAALPAFLDLFARRLTSLEYRSKESTCQALEPRRPQDSRLAKRLFSLMGLRHHQGSYPVPKGSILAVAGLMANRRPSKAKVQKVLRLWLRLPVEVNDHVGGWHNVDPAHHTRLGHSFLTKSQVLGKRVWLQQGVVDLTLRAIPYTTLLEYIAIDRKRRPAAREKIRSCVGLLTEFRWPTRLKLTTPWRGVPLSRLMGRWTPSTDGSPCMLLGKTSWLKGRATDGDNPITRSPEVSTTIKLESRL